MCPKAFKFIHNVFGIFSLKHLKSRPCAKFSRAVTVLAVLSPGYPRPPLTPTPHTLGENIDSCISLTIMKTPIARLIYWTISNVGAYIYILTSKQGTGQCQRNHRLHFKDISYVSQREVWIKFCLLSPARDMHWLTELGASGHVPTKVNKKGKQKRPGRATSSVLANPWHQEEEKKWHRLTCA